jgi:hypothetical protein
MSLAYRRPGIVDVRVPLRPGIRAFQFQAASNFDAVFADLQLVPNSGFVGAAILAEDPVRLRVASGLMGDPPRGHARFLFNPNFYTGAVPAVADGTPFFLRVRPVDDAGSVGTAEAMQMVLPYDSAPSRPVILSGTAPSGAGIANSLEIQLPGQCHDFDFQNNGNADLFVAFERPGAEYTVSPVTSAFKSFKMRHPSVSQVFVRGGGGTTAFSSIFTLRTGPR